MLWFDFSVATSQCLEIIISFISISENRWTNKYVIWTNKFHIHRRGQGWPIHPLFGFRLSLRNMLRLICAKTRFAQIYKIIQSYAFFLHDKRKGWNNSKFRTHRRAGQSNVFRCTIKTCNGCVELDSVNELSVIITKQTIKTLFESNVMKN